MRLTLTLAILVLTGCGSVKVLETQLPEGTYRLEYQPGLVEAYVPVMGALEDKASELCPKGWTKVSQGKSGDWVYDVFWVVECVGDSTP
jgi:hypothetical protein